MTGVWNDAMLRDYCHSGMVEPFEPANVNPASYDLRLGNTMRRADRMYRSMTIDRMRELVDEQGDWNFPTWGEPFEFESAWIMPGEFVLCHSLEYVRIPVNASALLFSKSSMGRVGLEHSHAGLGDPGFEGNWTWEWSNIAPWPIQVFAGKRYMQMQLYSLIAPPVRDYSQTGRYQNQTGPTPSRG